MASKSSSRVLTDHDEIQRWAEERGARPAAVRTTHTDDNVGIIRLDFPGYSGEGSLEEIEWDEWFDNFDDHKLALIVQDETADGEQSNFNKLVSRDNVESEGSGRAERSSGNKNSSRRGSKTKSVAAGSKSKSSKPAEQSGAGHSRGRKKSGRKSSSHGRSAA